MDNIKPSILLAEDDLIFGDVLRSYLELSNFEVTWALNGIEAYKAFNSKKQFDICLLDIMMPEMDGFTLAKEIRSSNHQIPFIFLSAKSLKEDVLKGYQCGADDYIIKPFDAEVLNYKIAAILQRTGHGQRKNNTDSFVIGNYQFDFSTRILKLNGDKVQLSPKEAELLHLLCSYKNEVLPREIALKQIWKNDDYFSGRSMDVYIAKLRKLLRDDLSLEIVSVHGKGFRLTDELIKIQTS